MRLFRYERGSALPETTLVVGLVMMIFFGIIKLAFVGYKQSETDAVVFTAAHAASLTATQSAQSNRGALKVQGIFPHFPSARLTVSPGTAGSNLNGDITAVASLTAGGLFTNQAFGGAVFNLHSAVVEPVVYGGGGDLSDVLQFDTTTGPFSTYLMNCTTNNPATPSCDHNSFAVPDYTQSNPYYRYECRLAYYATLSNRSTLPWGGRAPKHSDIVSQFPHSASQLASLRDGNNHPISGDNDPWPAQYAISHGNSGYSSSINNDQSRSDGVWLQAQSTLGNTWGDATGGGAGYMLTKIFDFVFNQGGNTCS